MLSFLSFFVELIQPLLVPLCFIIAWTFILALAWTLWTAIKETANRTKTMHQIPCSRCQYFTNNYRLKCPVNPYAASTEQAINCPDYQGISTY